MNNNNTFNLLVLPIGVSLIDIGPVVDNQLSLELQIMLRLHDMSIQHK